MPYKINKPYKVFFRTLANNIRINILHSLIDKPKSVSELVNALKYNQTTISHNLKILKYCRFVEGKKEGKKRIYSLNSETILPLIKLIDRHTEKYCANICYKNE